MTVFSHADLLWDALRKLHNKYPVNWEIVATYFTSALFDSATLSSFLTRIPQVIQETESLSRILTGSELQTLVKNGAGSNPVLLELVLRNPVNILYLRQAVLSQMTADPSSVAESYKVAVRHRKAERYSAHDMYEVGAQKPPQKPRPPA